MQFLTTEQVAERLGLSLRRVQTMAQSGRLPASRFGRALMINEADLTLVAERKPGRPKKADEAEAIEATRASAPVGAKAKKATNGAAAKPAKKRGAKKGAR